MAEIAAAIVAGLFSVGNIYIGAKMRRMERDLRTNHGHSAGYYLERIEDVARAQESFLLLLHEHTASDTRQFEAMARRLDALASQS